MFNLTLKNDALSIHQKMSDRYNLAHKHMMEKSSELYENKKGSVYLIEKIEIFINTIANTPKEFEKKMGLVKAEIKKFKETNVYAKEALKSEIHAGVGVVAATAAGTTFATMAPTVAMQVAHTFGTASTGTAIRALSGAAAQKAALAWLGGGALSVGGAGIAGGEALLALAGPVGWSISAISAGASLFSMSKKNKEISDKAIEESKKIMAAKEEVDEITKKIEDLSNKIRSTNDKLKSQFASAEHMRNANYSILGDDDVKLLGTLVNNTLQMASLVNAVIG